MRIDEIDNFLAEEEPLLPSSGFLASVMEKVQEEAAAPQPIPFPLQRALPGMILAGGALGWGMVAMIREADSAQAVVTHLSMPASFTGPLHAAGWLALALGASFGSWLLSRRICAGLTLY